MTDETMPFAEVVQATDTCHLWTGGVCVRHCISAIGDKGMDNDAAAINAAHESRCQARERRAAVKALREAAKKWPKGRGKFESGDFGLWLEAEAAAIESVGPIVRIEVPAPRSE